MKVLQTFFVFCLLTMTSVGMANNQPSSSLSTGAHYIKYPEKIKVLLNKDITEALLEVRGPYYIFNPENNVRAGSGLLGKRFLVHATPEGIKWGELFTGIHQIMVIPRSTETSILINGIQYDGSVAIYKIKDKIHIINELPIESYIKSQLTSEFTFPLESEAMAALAIASRTTAYFHTTKNINAFWHIDAKETDYNGSALIVPNSYVDQAVEATRNLILLNPQKDNNNVPFAALWTEHCGGKTAPLHQIFRKNMQAPEDCVNAPHAALDREDTQWSYSVSKTDLAKSFNIDKIQSLEIFVDNHSKKVYGCRIKDAKQNQQVFDFFKFQNILGKENIQSNDFSILIKDAEVTFTGYGKGHGVGICLFSASAMAQNGDIAVKILTKFFPNTYLTNLSAVAN